jgi:hypothetical protein
LYERITFRARCRGSLHGVSIFVMRGAAMLFLALVPHLLAACSCVTSLSTCQEVAASNVVFIGTVQAVEPNLLDAWSAHAHRNWMQDPELLELRKNRSASGVAALQARYLHLLSDLPDAAKARILAAGTQEELQTVITWIQSQGTMVRFQVRTMFQQKEDSDSDGKDSDSDTKKNRAPAAKPIRLRCGMNQAIVESRFRKAKPTSSTLSTMKNQTTWEPTCACGPPGCRMPGTIWLIFISSNMLPDNRAASKALLPPKSVN